MNMSEMQRQQISSGYLALSSLAVLAIRSGRRSSNDKTTPAWVENFCVASFVVATCWSGVLAVERIKAARRVGRGVWYALLITVLCILTVCCAVLVIEETVHYGFKFPVAVEYIPYAVAAVIILVDTVEYALTPDPPAADAK